MTATKNDVIKTLMTMATLYDKAMNADAATMLLSDLDCLAPEAILEALKKCRMELTRFPTLAEIASRAQIGDGRPGVEQAWSECPKDEYKSAYLNNEIMQGWEVANNILKESGDMVSARMAFKEVYERIVREARSNGIQPKWFFSPGYDKQGRIAAMRDAVEKGRITLGDALKLVPELPNPNQQTLPNSEVTKLITDTMKGLD